MSKKRSLADELAELFNPAPTKEFDPEADVFGAGPALVESDDQLVEQLQQQGRRRGKEAARLRGDIEMGGAQYKGRRTSRSAMFGSGSEGESDGDGEGGSDSGGSGSSGEEAEEGGAEEELLGGSDEEGKGGAPPRANGLAHGGGLDAGSGSEEEGGGGSGSDEELADAADEQFEEEEEEGAGDLAGLELEGSDREDSSGSEGEDEDGVARSAGNRREDGSEEEGEMAALEREYAEMRAAEAEAAAGLRERAAKERQKALAVQAQQALWQRGLELRILLQRALQGANRLPQAAVRPAAVEHSEELQAAYAGLASDAAGLLGDLSELVDALHQQNAAVREAAGEARVGQKRPREDDSGAALAAEQLWEELDGLYGGFAPFRDASVDRWHRKTTLTTGGAVRSSLRALNQSVSTQVATMMRDPQKLLQRTRLLRPHSKPLCAPAGGASQQAQQEEAPAEAYEGDDERDPETFDDTEFYQTLLREFLEGSDAAGGGSGWLSGPKQRKAVDRRASKGRKIRYHVHEKLVNFMTPVDLEAPQFAAQLFGNLFGGVRAGR